MSVEIYNVDAGNGEINVMTWAEDGKGRSWRDVLKVSSKMPCPNGKKGERSGWIYEYSIRKDAPVYSHGGRRLG